MPDRPTDVLDFWFGRRLAAGESELRRMEWWFRGGADAGILERFAPLHRRAEDGELDDWASEPRERLALILVLDQFSRTIHRGTALAYAQDAKAHRLAREGIDLGHLAALDTAWEKTFFFLPLGHAEDLGSLELAVRLAEELARSESGDLGRALAFSAEQARGHRDVIARFGRQPHRNEILGRRSTPEELEYLEKGDLVHLRPTPDRRTCRWRSGRAAASAAPCATRWAGSRSRSASATARSASGSRGAPSA